jgi:hypothetical protein
METEVNGLLTSCWRKIKMVGAVRFEQKDHIPSALRMQQHTNETLLRWHICWLKAFGEAAR